MDYLIHQLLKNDEVKKIYEMLSEETINWEDGKNTAGEQAAKVKKNKQLKKSSDVHVNMSEYIRNKLVKDELIRSFCLPKDIHGIMFTKSEQLDGYGMHVDNAYMSSGRSDLSFTIFLNNKNDYKGGELCIQAMQEEKEIKLSEGKIIIYPSTTLHSVKKVEKGERIVCVGWIESYIKSQEDRNLLFGLEAGARSLLAKNGPSEELDLIFQAYNNLLRRLGA